MNTERPDHDDEPRPVSGDAPDTEGARPRTTSSSEAPASDTDAVGTRDAAAAEDSGTSAPAGDAGASGVRGSAEDAGGLTRTGEAGTADRPEETRPEGGPSGAGADGRGEVRPAAGVHRTGAAGAEGPEPKAAGADAPAPSRLTKPGATGPADGDAPRTGETGPSQAAAAGDEPAPAHASATSAQASADAPAPSRLTKPEATGPADGDAPRTGETGPSQAAAAGDEPAPAHASATSAQASANAPASTPGAAGPEGASDESRAEGNGSAPADASTDTGAAGEDRPARADAPSSGADGGESSGASAAEASGPAGGTPTAPRTPPAGDEHAYAGPEPVVGGSRDAGRGSEGQARRRTPALVASVAAAVLLVGGGGRISRPGPGTPGRRDAGGERRRHSPPLALDGYSESGPSGIAPGEPNPYGATYRAEGALPDGPDTAPVFHARGKITEDQVVALAEALGVEGRPFAEGGSWRIGGQDGSGPTLRVDTQAPGTWTFSRNITRSDNCKGATCKAPTGAKTAAVSEEAAKKAAAPVLKAVGQDDAKLDASQVLDGSRVVNADPEVGGLPTYGWTTGVVVGASGEVVGGSGRLAEPVKGDEYPVVSAREALDAMNGAPGAGDRVEIGGCATPVPLDEGQQQQEPCAPAKPAGDTVAVDEAVFGLAAHSVDGRPALVPSWLFEVRPAGSDNPFTVTHPAVEPQFLAAPTGPGERPGEEPSGPGDEPTSAPATRDVEVEGYTAQGDELTVTFTGGVCADYEATASESGGKVTVRVTETPWPDKVCILIAKQYEQTLRLDAPLGDRQVVTADGEPVPLHKGGARLPAPPSAR
ncbi:hypothetical protein [Streptomyces sp. MNU103]|uniref:hypothetical protein n=1 Tax=Streptomyces sp. MNU103 TaxID=2560024 RepID=UPI001E4B6EDB|nr:hypothetical protein [Streptomyces sp. MNU103]